MNIEEMLTKFTADISDYREKMNQMVKDLGNVAGVTDEVKDVTQKAMNSSSDAVKKFGKDLQNLIDKQNKSVQATVNSASKLADYKDKVKLLVSDLNAQKKAFNDSFEAFKRLNTQYDEQKKFLADYGDGMDGVSRHRQELLDYIHNANSELSKMQIVPDLYGKDVIEKTTKELENYRNELVIFDRDLKDVGLNPDNLKTDTLGRLQTEMQKLSAEQSKWQRAQEQTKAKIDSTNRSIFEEENRLSGLKSKVEQNASRIGDLNKKIKDMGKGGRDVSKLKFSFSGLGSMLQKMGAIGAVTFAKLRKGLSGVRTSSNNTNKSLLNVAKSIRRIGIVSLGLRVTKSIFGQLRSVVSQYLSKNEQLNNRVQALKDSFANALAPAIYMVVGLFEKLMPYVLSVTNAIGNLFNSIGISKFMQSTSSSIGGVTESVEELSKAQKDLYGFDQITKQTDDSSSNSSGGSSSSGGNLPSAAEQFSKYLEEIKKLWDSGDFEEIGAKIAGSLNQVISKINALDWDGIQKKVNDSMQGMARVFNGFVYEFDWNGAGQLVGNGLNTITGAIISFVDEVDWKELGSGIADSLNGLFEKLNGENLGKALTSLIKMALETLNGFVKTFNWKGFGDTVADMILGAIKNIDWGNAGETISKLVTGLIDSIISFFDKLTEDEEQQQTISNAITDFLSNIEIGEIIVKISKLVFSILKFGWTLGGNFSESFGEWAEGKGEDFNNFMIEKINVPVETFFTVTLKDKFSDAWESTKKKWDELKDKTAIATANLKDSFSNSWNNTRTKWNDLKTKTATATANLKDSFTTSWNKTRTKWNETKSKTATNTLKMKDSFTSGWNKVKKTWDGIKDKKATATLNIKASITHIKEFINEKIITPMNKKIQSVGILKNVGIPKLAQGAVIPPGQEFYAVLGDQKHGRNLEAPENLIRQIVREESGGNNAPINLTIPITIGGRLLKTIVIEDANNDTQRKRMNAILS